MKEILVTGVAGFIDKVAHLLIEGLNVRDDNLNDNTTFGQALA